MGVVLDHKKPLSMIQNNSTGLNLLGRPIEIAHFWGRCFEAYIVKFSP
jgi:hypothetical protein